MTRTIRVVMAVLLIMLFPIVATGGGMSAALKAEELPRLLIVDGTRTFASTMRIGALAGILRQSGIVDVSVKFVDVESSYQDPLANIAVADQPYDIILIIPSGIDDGSMRQIWLVSRFFASGSAEHAGLAALSGIIDQIFHGIAEAIDVSEDLFPGFFAALYLMQGWLR